MSKINNKITSKMQQLEDIINWFDSDEFMIDLAIDKYKQAQSLARDIETDLLSIKNEVEVLKKKFDTE